MKNTTHAANTAAPRIITTDELLNFGCELGHVADTDPEAAEAFTRAIENAMMELHRSRKYSTMLVEANGVVKPAKPLEFSVSAPDEGYGTIYLNAESGCGLAMLSLTLPDAKRLHRELGAAIRQLKAILHPQPRPSHE